MTGNPERYQEEWPSAIIAGAHRTGVVAMRDLSRRGVPVSCVDCDPTEAGFLRRYGKAHICPNPDENSEGWLRFMLALARNFDRKPALIPASDRFLSAIANHAQELADAYSLGADPKLQDRLSQKESLYLLANEHGMPIPRTGKVRTAADLFEFAKRAVFPCLLKPMSAREWEVFPPGHPLHLAKVAVAQDIEQLLQLYRVVASISPILSIQEVIEGPDTAKLVYLSCYDRSGRRIGNAMVRELRCHPQGFGSAGVCEPCADAEADAVCDEFLQRAGCRGLCEIELKRDSRDQSLKMIEANPRLSVTGDAAAYDGVDLCWLHYLDLIGQHVEPVNPQVRDYRHIMVVRDVQSLRQAWENRKLQWRDIARTYKRPLVFYDVDLHDLRYTLKTCYFALHVIGGAICRKFVPKRYRSA